MIPEKVPRAVEPISRLKMPFKFVTPPVQEALTPVLKRTVPVCIPDTVIVLAVVMSLVISSVGDALKEVFRVMLFVATPRFALLLSCRIPSLIRVSAVYVFTRLLVAKSRVPAPPFVTLPPLP